MSDVTTGLAEPTWGVVATVREPADLVLAFVAHHLELGAKQLQIFFDDPKDPAIPLLQAVPRVRVYRCGPGYWKKVTGGKGRPDNQNQRQARNAQLAYEQGKADYLIHLDADEFLHMARPLSEEVARLEEGECWLRVPTLERCWLAGDPAENVFSGLFRAPLRNAVRTVKRIYGAEAMPFLSNGLAGSAHGKPLVRAGEKIQLQVHAAKLPGKEAGWAPHRKATGLFVLHYDGLTPLHWVAKSLRYAEQGDEAIDKLLHEARANQVRAVREMAGDLPALLQFYREIATLTPDQAEALTAQGALLDLGVNPEAAMRRHFPDHRPQLSMRAFDLGMGSENARRLMGRVPEGAPEGGAEASSG